MQWSCNLITVTQSRALWKSCGSSEKCGSRKVCGSIRGVPLHFAHYGSKLKNEILVAQKSMHSPEVAPTHLPDSIVIFLVKSCAMTKRTAGS